MSHLNSLNYNHLYYFFVTAQVGGMTAAAELLNTSQSSLSTQIKTLEENLGRKLFKKVGRKVELTDFGKETLGFCRRAFSVFDEFFDQLDLAKVGKGIRISIGVSLDIERPFITDVLANVVKAYPQAQRPLLNLISVSSPQLQQLMNVGEIDFLVTSDLILDREARSLGTFDFPVGLVGSRDHGKLAAKKSLTDMVREGLLPFVLPSKATSLRPEIEQYFVRRNIRPVCAFESNIISSVIRAAMDGLGATILPLVYLSREISSGKLVMLSGKPMWRHRVDLLTHRTELDERRGAFAKLLVTELDAAQAQSTPAPK